MRRSSLLFLGAALLGCTGSTATGTMNLQDAQTAAIQASASKAATSEQKDLATLHAATAQFAAQRYHRVPGRDAAGRRLGQERLVRHVRLRVDHDDLRVTVPHLLRQPQGRVEPDVAAAHHKDPVHRHGCHASPDRGGPAPDCYRRHGLAPC